LSLIVPEGVGQYSNVIWTLFIAQVKKELCGRRVSKAKHIRNFVCNMFCLSEHILAPLYSVSFNLNLAKIFLYFFIINVVTITLRKQLTSYMPAENYI
jgi:hypothetical protein